MTHNIKRSFYDIVRKKIGQNVSLKLEKYTVDSEKNIGSLVFMKLDCHFDVLKVDTSKPKKN